MNEDPKSTEEQLEKIETIDSYDALGYPGAGREEHSGENAPTESDDLRDDLADNDPGERP